MRIKTNFINVILLITSFVIFVLISEAIFRSVSLLFRPKLHPTYHSQFCEYDPLLGWKHKTNIKNIFITDEYSVPLSFNSKGMRGPEHSYNKDKNEFRILILGDSFSEGYAVNFNELFSEVLKNKLNGEGVGCEVINAGVRG